MKTKALLTFVTILLASAGAGAASYNPDTVLPQLQESLRQARTAKDSLKVMYDIYDVSKRADRRAAGQELFRVAQHAGDVSAQLDILRLNANMYTDEADNIRLQKLAAAIPASQERDETILFLKLRNLASTSRESSVENDKEFASVLRRLNTIPSSKQNASDRLLNLYTVTAYMRHASDSDMLVEYMDSLMNLVGKQDYKLYALRNLIYSEAANIYSDAGQYRKAVEADRELLKIVDELDARYKADGRHYRDYSESRFIIYRRQLRNYKALEPAEVDKYYEACKALAAQNASVADVIDKYPAVHAYYYMAKGHYAKAMPLLKTLIAQTKATPALRQLYQMLETSARETGDSATLVSALAEYGTLMDKMEKDNIRQRYTELQIAYDVNKLKENNVRLRMEQAEEKARSLRTNLTYNIAVWMILVVLLAILLFYWSRYRGNVVRLNRLAAGMARQRDKLKSDLYSEYDYNPDVTETQFKNSNDTTKLVHSILSNIMYISAIGHDEREKHLSEVSVDGLLRKLRGKSAALYSDSTELDMSYPEHDYTIFTDPDCVEYLLMRILEFAHSRSHGGKVTLAAKHVEGSRMMQFIFTHSGDRIPRGREESLFENFMNLDELEQRDDASLFLCRLIVVLLQCHIAYNPHVDGPARLVVTLPMRLNA